jgi:hypothetical protein
MFKGFLVDRSVIDTDVHLAEGCAFCHKGDERARDRETAHHDMVRRPSDNLGICGRCHEGITASYEKSLHFTTAGLRNGVGGRFSKAEAAKFDSRVFEASCRQCHASCGDCHVKGPRLGAVCTGLIQGHRFVRKNEARTCGFCHGGRVYPEFTGQYGVVKDAHFEKGMMCMDCHSMEEMHGDGKQAASRREVAARPRCETCHPAGEEKAEKAREAHEKHQGKLSCTACHALSSYKNCSNCHLGKGGQSRIGFFLGRSPSNKNIVTTLRLVPTVRDTFANAGIAMENYDALPNYWDTVPHVMRRVTERTTNCAMCHLAKMGFLTRSNLIEGGARANEDLLVTPKPIKP